MVRNMTYFQFTLVRNISCNKITPEIFQVSRVNSLKLRKHPTISDEITSGDVYIVYKYVRKK